MNRKLLTLAIIVRDDRVLLGMKKRGFGAGRWNGFGGKVQEGESIEEAARRETKEESGVAITNMTHVGTHDFCFAAKPSEVLEVHVFRVDDYKWEPVETEEMRPQWFLVDTIPNDEMWPDDRHWLPIFLAGKKFRTHFLFGENDQVLEHQITVLS